MPTDGSRGFTFEAYMLGDSAEARAAFTEGRAPQFGRNG